MSLTISQGGYVVPFAYSIGRAPNTGLFVVKRNDRVVTNSQTDLPSAAAFARAHAELHPEQVRKLDDDDPGPDRWQECAIRRQLRQHRHEAQTRTG